MLGTRYDGNSDYIGPACRNYIEPALGNYAVIDWYSSLYNPPKFFL